MSETMKGYELRTVCIDFNGEEYPPDAGQDGDYVRFEDVAALTKQLEDEALAFNHANEIVARLEQDVVALQRANETLVAPVTLDEWLKAHCQCQPLSLRDAQIVRAHVAGANAVLNKRRAALAGQDAASGKGVSTCRGCTLMWTNGFGVSYCNHHEGPLNWRGCQFYQIAGQDAAREGAASRDPWAPKG